MEADRIIAIDIFTKDDSKEIVAGIVSRLRSAAEYAEKNGYRLTAAEINRWADSYSVPIDFSRLPMITGLKEDE